MNKKMVCSYCQLETFNVRTDTLECADTASCRERQVQNAVKSAIAAEGAQLWARMHEWRGLEADEVCTKCQGGGCYSYPNTSTWSGGYGGQALTVDVCDKCWGSGSVKRPWIDRRKLRSQLQAHTELEAKYRKAEECLKALAAYEPSEMCYDEFAYRRLVESYREAALKGLGVEAEEKP